MKRTFRFTPLTLNAIRRHAGARRDAAAIARLMDCEPGTIENICGLHGIELVKIPDGAPPLKRRTGEGRAEYVTVEVPVESKALLLIRREAARRGVKPSTLIARVAELVATDSMFAAVLDQ